MSGGGAGLLVAAGCLVGGGDCHGPLMSHWMLVSWDSSWLSKQSDES